MPETSPPAVSPEPAKPFFDNPPIFHKGKNKKGLVTYYKDGVEYALKNPKEIPPEIMKEIDVIKEAKMKVQKERLARGRETYKANCKARKANPQVVPAVTNPNPDPKAAATLSPAVSTPVVPNPPIVSSPPPASAPPTTPEQVPVENPKPAEEPAAPAPGPVENPPSIAEIKEKGKEIKAQVKKTLKGIKLYIVTFIKDEKQHIWAVKAENELAAKNIIGLAETHAKGIALHAKTIASGTKYVCAWTLDEWLEHVWREWPMRRKIARGLSKASKEMNWHSLSARAKAIAKRNFLMMRIHNWAANPPETWDDVDDEIAGADEVDDGYEPEAPIQNPPYNQLPGKRYNIPTGYYITKENPPAENNDVPACKHCGGQIINTGKYAHNPRGAKVFWLLECQDCKAKYKLTDS